MIQAFNPITTIALIYIGLFIICTIDIAIRHEDWPTPISIFMGAFWPIYYFTLCLIFILQEHDTRQKNDSSKIATKSIKAKENIQQNKTAYTNSKSIRKGRAFKVKTTSKQN